MGTLLRSLMLLLLFLVAFHQINRASFIDPWTTGLEETLSNEKFSRLYMDGPRPFFVQRSHPTAKIFYDLNPRFRSSGDKSQICVIKACFDPELWVIGNYLKPPETLAFFANEFETVLHHEQSFFVAKNPKTDCGGEAPRCESLLMIK